MAALHSSQPRLSQERGINDGQSTSSHQHAVARDSAEENLDPLPASRVFEGMLKTTTETGDIGIFSLKASRISQPLSGPRRIYHPPQPLFRHFQPGDDRCHILSQPHDASSEILSTYDTTSQRSMSQYSAAQDTNRHSYSATYSSPIVSNRRPYVTLANKTGENGPSSCPRSPLSSTARVIRPARSCFPVLVDGDDTSILPNAEAEQLLYERAVETLSPSPLYFRKQRPPSSPFRHNSSKPTPSLLAQTSQSYRKRSPNSGRSNSGPAANNWKQLNKPTLMTVSSASSDASLASAGSLRQTMPLYSTPTTPIRENESCPLFYDYSEYFDANKYCHLGAQEQQPHCYLGRAIPQNRKVRTVCQERQNCNNPATESSFVNVFPALPPADIWEQKQDDVQSPTASNTEGVFGAGTADISRDDDFTAKDILAIPNYKCLANGCSENSSLHPSCRLASRSKTVNERLSYLTIPFSPLVNYEIDECRGKNQSLNLGIMPVSTSVPDSGNEEDFHQFGQLRQKVLTQPEYPTGTPALRPKMGQMGSRRSVPQFPQLLLQPELFCRISKNNSVHNRRLRQEDQQSASTPLEMDSVPSQIRFEHHEEETLLQASHSSSTLALNLQTPTSEHNGSPECSSSYNSVGSCLLSGRLFGTESTDGNEYNEYNKTDVPKFRLKITRPSDSILGTVRMNRMSADSKPLSVQDLCDPRDLFTPTSGTGNIFRQVNQHFNAPRVGSGSIHSQVRWEQAPRLGPDSNKLPDKPPSSELNILRHFAATDNPSDEQSFFSDDSSRMYEKRKLRKRLSNLRARVGKPNSSKTGPHNYDGAPSYDGVGLKNGNCARHATFPVIRSADNLHVANTKAMASYRHRLREKIHGDKWRERMSIWIRGAKSKIVAHMRSET